MVFTPETSDSGQIDPGCEQTARELLWKVFPQNSQINCRCGATALIITGTVSSWYEKQLAQEVLLQAFPKRDVINQLLVVPRN